MRTAYSPSVSFLFLLVLSLGLCASGCSWLFFGEEEELEQKPRIEVIDSGIFEDSYLKLSTSDVALKRGASFGFRFKLDQALQGDREVLKLTTRYPGLLKPGTREVVFEESREIEAIVGETVSFTFTFHSDWEMVEGEWSFEVTAQDGSKVTRTFQVFKSTAM